MGSELFGRIGSVSVTQKGAARATEFKGLRFSFNVSKTSEANPNNGKVTIFNLSAQGRALVEEPDSQVIVKAGYSGFGVNPLDLVFDKSEIIYVGDVRLNGIHNERQGPDIATTLECSTGLIAMREAKMNKSYAPGTTALQVITDMASSLGLDPSQIQTTGADVFLNGLSLSGSTKDLLSGMLKKLGVQWSIQDDELHIVDKKLPTAEPVVLLNEKTGLIGVPTKRSNGGYVFRSLLNPKIRPGRPLAIQSETVGGLFKPRKVDHQGDLDGGPWDTVVEAVEVSG